MRMRTGTERNVPVDILNRQRRVAGFDVATLRQRADWVVRAAGVDEMEVCVTLLSDRRIRTLNRDYRNKDKATDVLSFAQNEGEFADLNTEILGDVLISVETADRQRETRTLMDEVTHLLIHGVLHLMGYDHMEDAEATLMEAEEQRIWSVIRSEETR